MRTLIITVAGTATRFNQGTTTPTLKCLYEKGGPKYTLLYQILDKAQDYEEYVIVGGYLYDQLEKFVDNQLPQFRSKIKLVYNAEYATFGSGYSLLLGLQNANPKASEILFVEGDLFFDSEAFDKIKASHKNVFTVNRELITAKKAVVVYEDTSNFLHYLYDTTHSYLQIPQPFLAVYNSGQVWKFVDTDKLTIALQSLSEDQARGTNLEIIQAYFGNLTPAEYEMVVFNTWHNCNTVQDYDIVRAKIK